MTGDDIVKAFEKEDDIRAVDDAVKNIWPKLFEDIYAGIEVSDLTKVRNVLDKMLEKNKDYMIRSARRYAELMERLH
jgi:hypothetical protein